MNLPMSRKDEWIRVIFRCNYCGADHAYPSRKDKWIKRSQAAKYLKEHLMMCPGCVDLMCPPHIEVIDPESDEIIRHSDHFSVVKEAVRPKRR